MPILKKIIFTAFFSLIIVSSGYFVVFAWTAPTGAPPAGNIAAPLNTGSVTQSKTGGLNVNGNVGIGTTNPTYKLDVSGDGRFSTNLFVTGALYANQLNFVAMENKVGIGSTSPTQKLSVGGIIYSGSGGFKFPDGTIQTTAAGGASQWITSGSNIYYNTGNVGIGVASPSQKLEISNGNIVLARYGTAASRAVGIGDGGGSLLGTSWWGGIEIEDDGVGNNNVYLVTTAGGVGSASRKLTVKSSGDVGIGTTDPGAKLEVAGNVKIQGSINRGPTNLPLFRWLPIGTMTSYASMGDYDLRGIAFDGANMWTAEFDESNGNSVAKNTPTGTKTIYSGTALGPRAIAFDGTNMWTADYMNKVTKITPSGTMTTYSGTGGLPRAIAFDGTNMWTANSAGNSVTKITPSGTMTTYSGTGNQPYGIAFDGTNMWTANYGGNSVTKITPSGAMTTYSGAGTYPQAIAFDGTNMWTANSSGSSGNSVTKITPSGAMTTYSGTGTYPQAIAFDGTNMWTANTYGGSVTKITPAGTMTTYGGIGDGPQAIAFDGTNMWTANLGGNVTKILVITQ